MDGMYGFHSTSDYVNTPENDLILPAENQSSVVVDQSSYWPYYGSDDLLSVAASVISDAVSMIPDHHHHQIVVPRRRSNRPCDRARNGGLEVGDGDDEASGDTIKERIASHPSYSKLLAAYIDCRKVGAPPEIACLLDDILVENDARRRSLTASTCLGIDPELDDFMETYFHVLVKYKSDLARPFDEAAVFLGNIETQLRNLCKDEGGNVSSEEEFSGGETDNNTQMSQELKHTLLRKFGGRIGSLKQEFTKKKKKGKLPKEARQKLLEWWNSHNKWPYPTEGDKISLAETTGLDPKQINNWFINQRKRHWKPSESMQLAVMGALPGQHLYDD